MLAARDPQRLEDAAAACRALGAEVLVVPTDVAEEGACRALIERAVERFGGIDALVNNAGITMWTRFDAVKDFAAFEHIMRVNYLSGVYPTAAALPHLKKSRGLIVAVASMAGLTGVPERTGYAASKHAQIGFFDSLRIELSGSGVDVTRDRAGLRREPDPPPRARPRRQAARRLADGRAAHHDLASSARG